MEIRAITAVLIVLAAAFAFMAWRRRRGIDSRIARIGRAIPRDPGSGLSNRQGFLEAGAVLLSRMGGRVVAVMMVDIGTDAPAGTMGELAPGIAALLPAEAAVGVVGPTQFACALAIDPYAPQAPEHMAERIEALLSQHGGKATIGMARSDRDGGSIEALAEAAEIAASVARADGARILWFEQDMATRRRAREMIARSLPEAIDSGAIQPYFDPLVDLHTGELLGFEVLARWEHPAHGTIAPAHFIDVARETKAIADLTLSVMRQALAAARDWDRRLVLSVNFAVTQLRDPWVAQKVIRLLTELGYPAARLEIELTEGALMDPHGIAPSIIESLKAQGVRVALDDFGTGVSSLTHLRALPFDRIKIDHKIVTGICAEPARAEIVDAIVRLGESLSLPVTAEGVENGAIAERLRAMRCPTGQGHLFGQPMNLMQTRRMLAERRLMPATAAQQRLAG
ncbi:MAG: EAL domain-containing protein [Sphingomonas bacterium]